MHCFPRHLSLTFWKTSFNKTPLVALAEREYIHRVPKIMAIRAPTADMTMHKSSVLRVLWCLFGATIGLGISLSVAGPTVSPFLLTSLGGTTIFLFGLTRAPAAQPRALFGGHTAGAAIGIACYQSFGDGLWVYVLSVMLSMAFMLSTRTVHPPAGANPILMVYVHASWTALWQPVLLGVLVLVLVAMVWSRLYPGLCHYPASPFEPSPPKSTWGGWA